MANYKSDRKSGCDYSQEVKELKKNGPGRVYLLHGPEDYLRESFLAELKKICIPDGDDGFSYRRFEGPALDEKALENAVDVFPFLSQRTLIELRDVDLNKLSSSEKLPQILENIPDYCSVVFVQSAGYVPDGRLKLIKQIKTSGRELLFTEQPRKKLYDWIRRRFNHYEKEISDEAVQRLVFVSGDLMNKLIPEIEKVAAYAGDKTVQVSDVNAVAHKIPEAQAFDIIDQISEKNFDMALKIFSELIKGHDCSPIAFISSLGYQLRRIYGTKLAVAFKLSRSETMDFLSLRNDYACDKLIASAKRFSFTTLQSGIVSCVDAEYKMKSSSENDIQLLKDVLTGIIISEQRTANS